MKKKIEYSEDCPKCKNTMKRTDRDNDKSLIYYCKKCKQKYRIETVHPSQLIECPCCHTKIRLNEESIGNMWMNSSLNFSVRKVKVKL